MRKGGNMPCILNAANEVAVEAFLTEKVGFLKMADILEDCMQNIGYINKPKYSDYFETDSVTREYAKKLI
jgi:1-deoxy-D-xylulose-5-phosphate reductoisomerase